MVSRVELRSDILHICISIDVCALTRWVAKEKEELLELPRDCFLTVASLIDCQKVFVTLLPLVVG